MDFAIFAGANVILHITAILITIITIKLINDRPRSGRDDPSDVYSRGRRYPTLVTTISVDGVGN